MLLEAAAVIAVVGLVVYWLIVLLSGSRGRPTPRGRAVPGGRWAVAHYEARGVTRVVVRRVGPRGDRVLDEQLVAEIRVADPDYDQLFLTAMSAARERQALFESEEEH